MDKFCFSFDIDGCCFVEGWRSIECLCDEDVAIVEFGCSGGALWLYWYFSKLDENDTVGREDVIVDGIAYWYPNESRLFSILNPKEKIALTNIRWRW